MMIWGYVTCFCGLVLSFFLISLALVVSYTKKNIKEAAKMIFDAILEMVGSFRPKYHIAENLDFINEIRNIIFCVLGTARFSNLRKLGLYQKILFRGTDWEGLSCFAIIIPYKDDFEKQILEDMINEKTKEYLRRYGFKDCTVVDWGRDKKSGISCIRVRYAENNKQRKIMERIIEEKRRSAVKRFKPPQDDDVDEEDDT